jgi:RNA polymerase primary sigma factor
MKQIKITNQITNRDSDSVKNYLSEISKIELLTEEEEINLSVKIKEGDELAKEKLIVSNLKFVITVAKQYQNQGILFEDLINEGNIGLIKAAERFDSTRGFKFISYAVWWIRQSIMEALANNSRLIRIPSNQITSLYKMNKFFQDFEQKNQRPPTEEEISEMMEEDVKKISTLIRVSKKHSSLDAPIKNDDDSGCSTLNDLIILEEENNIEMFMDKESLSTDIETVISTLKLRQREIVCMYYGLMGYPKMTLEEIGEYYELTRERVRQIKDAAIRVLKHRSRSKILKQHLK